MENQQYPIGKFSFDKEATTEKRRGWLRDIAELPRHAREAVAGLTKAQLDTPYRDGGWTPRQVVHHMADSHMNAFIRIKLAITEQNPTIKPYDQNAWSTLPDVIGADVSLSLSILEGLHGRWSLLLESLQPKDFDRTFLHPENGPMTIDRAVQIYAWHCRHHVAHITSLRPL
jgi:hypothetical protein